MKKSGPAVVGTSLFVGAIALGIFIQFFGPGLHAHRGGWPRIEVGGWSSFSQISAQVVNIGHEPLRLWDFGVDGGRDTLSVLLRDPDTGQRLRLRRLPRASGPNP